MIPDCLDWGRDGPNAQWHRRWLTLALTVGPLALAAACIFIYGPEKGLAAAGLFTGCALWKGIDYGVRRGREG